MIYKKLFSNWTGVALLATMGLFACEPEIDTPNPESGSADFSTYVALGNSLTAGYIDGALVRKGQENSYSAMIANSMDAAGGIDGEFRVPLIPEGNGDNGSGVGRLELQLINGSPTPVPTAPSSGVFASVAGDGPYQNLGVPGAKSFHLTFPGYGSSQGNPFFARFASAPTTTVVADAAAQSPTFFTLWIGNNDVLGYALSGGDEGNDPITPEATFRAAMEGIVGGLDASASGGAIANIPDILSIPFLNTAAYDDFVLDATQATALNIGLRATVEASARPQITQVVTDTVEARTIRGVTEFVRENQVRPGVTAVVRDTVTARVRRGAIQQFIAGGANQAEAEEQADALIASEDGQAEIEARLQSPEAQAEIEQGIALQMQSAQVQAGIDAEVERRLALPETQATIEQNIQAQLEQIFATLPTVSEGANPFVIRGEATATNPTGIRSATPEDKILLTVLAFTNTPEFAALPVLPESLVLDVEEQANITAAINAYNSIISDVAGSKYAVVDMNNFFDRVKGGNFVVEGVEYSATFVTGNAFSLDGVHLTERGYALAANEFIRAINAKYNSSLPTVTVNDFDVNFLP